MRDGPRPNLAQTLLKPWPTPQLKSVNDKPYHWIARHAPACMEPGQTGKIQSLSCTHLRLSPRPTTPTCHPTQRPITPRVIASDFHFYPRPRCHTSRISLIAKRPAFFWCSFKHLHPVQGLTVEMKARTYYAPGPRRALLGLLSRDSGAEQCRNWN